MTTRHDTASLNGGTRRHPAGPPARLVRGRPVGIGRRSSAAAERVSDDLRRGGGPLLERRRRAGRLSLAASGALGVVAAYQLGLVERPPEPRLPFLGAREVDASGEAYHLLKTPDAALGLVSQAVTLVLVGAGTRRRPVERPALPLALAAKALADAAFAGWLTVEQVSKHRRLCSWCLLAAAANLATVPQVLPEARQAWRALTARRG